MFLLLFSIIHFSLAARLIEESRRRKRIERNSCCDSREINVNRVNKMDVNYIKDTVKLFNIITFCFYLVGIVLAMIFKNDNTVRVTLGIILAVKATLFALTNQSLENDTKSYTLGVFDLLGLSLVTGIVYLCWFPKSNKSFY